MVHVRDDCRHHSEHSGQTHREDPQDHPSESSSHGESSLLRRRTQVKHHGVGYRSQLHCRGHAHQSVGTQGLKLNGSRWVKLQARQEEFKLKRRLSNAHDQLRKAHLRLSQVMSLNLVWSQSSTSSSSQHSVSQLGQRKNSQSSSTEKLSSVHLVRQMAVSVADQVTPQKGSVSRYQVSTPLPCTASLAQDKRGCLSSYSESSSCCLISCHCHVSHAQTHKTSKVEIQVHNLIWSVSFSGSGHVHVLWTFRHPFRHFYTVFGGRACLAKLSRRGSFGHHQKNWQISEKLFLGGIFVFFSFLILLFFKRQVRWPFGRPHLALNPPYVFFWGFKGQVRWLKGPPHLVLNRPYFLGFVLFFCSPFLSLLSIEKKPVFPPKKGHFCLFLSVSLCFSLAFFGLPLF